jgi:hypothetical protein
MITLTEWTHKRRGQSLRRRIEIEHQDLPKRKLYLNLAASLEIGLPGVSMDRFGHPDRFRDFGEGKCRLEGSMWHADLRIVKSAVEIEMTVQNRLQIPLPLPFAVGALLSPCSPMNPEERSCPMFCDSDMRDRTYIHTGRGFCQLKDQRRHFFHQQQIEDILDLDHIPDFIEDRSTRPAVPYIGVGAIFRVSTDRRWVVGYGWDKTACVYAHSEEDALGAAVQLGPLKVGERKKIRGMVVIMPGKLNDALVRIRRFVGPQGVYDAKARRREVLGERHN